MVGLQIITIRKLAAGESSVMKKAESKVYKERLLLLRARLRGDVSQMADAALKKNRIDGMGDQSAMPIHMADLGSDNYEQEFTLTMMETEEGTLDAIETALERIEDGTYGQCEECGVKIPKTRLNALPHTPMCVKCAGNMERG
jgi:DnaK suppressor protein